MMFLHSHQHLLLFHFRFELHFLPSNLHLHLHDMSLVEIFDLIFPVIIFKKSIFKSSVLFGAHTLLDKSKSITTSNTSI